MNQTNVTIPATSANLGPGFDCLGMALALYNHVRLTIASDQTHISVTGLDAHKVAEDKTNLVYQAAAWLYTKAGADMPYLLIEQKNNIPVGSGLGSSSTAVLGGLLGANELLGRLYSQAEILAFATELEGHPDNVAPALHGSLVLGITQDDQIHIERYRLPPIQVTVVMPAFKLLTSEARRALPPQVPLADAIFNAGRTPLVIQALQTADYDKLALAMQDRIHQPYRIPLIPGMAEAMQAVRDAGASAVALSGAGPSLIAFAQTGHEQIGKAATTVFAQAGLDSRTWVLAIDAGGCQITTP